MAAFINMDRPSENSLRNKWKFRYAAHILANAASEKASIREGRVSIWMKKQKEIIAEVKEKGLEINESVSAQFSNYSTKAGRGARLEVSDKYQEQLDECFSRIKSNSEAALAYRAWQYVLDANKNELLELNYEDWLFFFGDEKLNLDESE